MVLNDDPATRTFLALITDALQRLLEEPEARDHVAGFASGDVDFVVTPACTKDRVSGAQRPES